jgi:hypothetical protein
MAEAYRRPATVTRFCFVADRAVNERLLHRLPAHPEEKPRFDAGESMTRLRLRESRSEDATRQCY